MTRPDDPRLAEARRISVMKAAEKLGIELMRGPSHEWVSPCPVHGGRRDRLNVNEAKNVWLCRGTDEGGDAVALVRHVKGYDFGEALTYLCGPLPDKPESADERARRLAREAEQEARIAQARAAREARAERERQRAIAAARAVWAEGRPVEGSPVAAYLERRGIDPAWLHPLPRTLRFHPALRYTVQEAGQWRAIHEGPAMLAAITDGAGQVIGVHRTWLDSREPKGKARIVQAGEAMPAKKVLGSMKGGAIRLGGVAGGRTLIVGEGIETTLTARAALAGPGRRFWCGVSLGNMAGRRMLRGEGAKYAGLPDLDDGEAWLPPEGVETLVFLQDGDSDPRLTRAKLLAGLRRARAKVASVRRIFVLPAPEGKDWNDALCELLRGDGEMAE